MIILSAARDKKGEASKEHMYMYILEALGYSREHIRYINIKTYQIIR